MLEKMLNNPIVKNAVLGSLRKTFDEEKLSILVVSLDDKGELKVDMYKEEMKVITVKEYTQMVESLKSIL